jgi:hypothetical protein
MLNKKGRRRSKKATRLTEVPREATGWGSESFGALAVVG